MVCWSLQLKLVSTSPKTTVLALLTPHCCVGMSVCTRSISPPLRNKRKHRNTNERIHRPTTLVFWSSCPLSFFVSPLKSIESIHTTTNFGRSVKSRVLYGKPPPPPCSPRWLLQEVWIRWPLSRAITSYLSSYVCVCNARVSTQTLY